MVTDTWASKLHFESLSINDEIHVFKSTLYLTYLCSAHLFATRKKLRSSFSGNLRGKGLVSNAAHSTLDNILLIFAKDYGIWAGTTSDWGWDLEG